MTKKCCVLILVATIIAIVLRLPRLEQRPMHGDEAVQAYKFGQLLEKNFYRYNPDEYHGPTLNYLTLIPAWLSDIYKFKDLTEFTLRIVPVLFGGLLVVLLLLLVDGLGWPIAIVAAILTAISPAMVFYSRYYIHEMLLVCFTSGVIASGYRYVQSKNVKWVLLIGIFVGLMHATKETCIIAFGSMLVAVLLTVVLKREPPFLPPAGSKGGGIQKWHLIAAVSAAIIVSAIFHSSFLTNPKGILDSLRTYATYFHRASHNQLHIHPWYYYLKILIYTRYEGSPLWSEAPIVLLAGAGFVIAMRGKGLPRQGGLLRQRPSPCQRACRSTAAVDFHLLRFIAFYTAIMAIVYSAIPYKTPWCLLGFLHGMILLAGVGAVALIKLTPKIFAWVLINLLLVAGIAYLSWQAYLANYKFFADPRNPYVYAHPVRDMVSIAQRVEDIAQIHPDGHNMHIQVICPQDDYWPLPWYLRSFSKVGYWNYVDKDAPPAPVIIASPIVEPALMEKLYGQPSPGEKR
jgi:uncharacterized protein (TIGR03663 family)